MACLSVTPSATTPRVGILEDASICCLPADATVKARIVATPRPRRPTPPAELLRLINYYYKERGHSLKLTYAFVAAKCGLKVATVERRHLLALRQAIAALPHYSGTQPR